VIESIHGKIFAGAMIAELEKDDGKMLAVIFPPESRTLGFHIFQLNEKHRNIIRRLKIPFHRRCVEADCGGLR
jgi:hypothetical protein